MAEKITVYQCPACMGPLRFDGKTGKLKCDYCGSVFTTAEAEALFADKNKAAQKADQAAHEKAKEAEAAAAAAAAGGAGRTTASCGRRRSGKKCSSLSPAAINRAAEETGPAPEAGPAEDPEEDPVEDPVMAGDLPEDPAAEDRNSVEGVASLIDR